MTYTIEEIKKLRAGITPGPWRNERERIHGAEDFHSNGKLRNASGVSSASFTDEVCRSSNDYTLPIPKANLSFIAASPAIVDQLLEENERIKAELKKELHDSSVYITRSETVVKELELRAQAAEDVALHWYTVWAEMTKPVGAYKDLPIDIQEEIDKRVAELREKGK